MVVVRFYRRPGGFKEVSIDSILNSLDWIALGSKEQEQLIKESLRDAPIHVDTPGLD